MLCYRDRTFCGFYKDCLHGENCQMALTEEVWEKASKWSETITDDGTVLICQYVDTQDCFVTKM